jgi:hypothetical protein
VLDRAILDWLSTFPDLWASLLFILAGQYEHAGALGELVVRADQASVAQALGGDPTKALAAPRESLQRKLLEGLRYLLKNKLKLNQAGPSDGWLTQDALWLVSKTVCDQLRAHLLSQGIEGIPPSNTAVFNVLQDHGVVQATPDGKAIWLARVASNAGWSHSFTLLRLAPSVIWDVGDRPAAFDGTVSAERPGAAASTDAISLVDAAPAAATTTTTTADAPEILPIPAHEEDELLGALLEAVEPEAAAIEAGGGQVSSRVDARSGVGEDRSFAAVVEDRPSGEYFVAWLREAVQRRKLVINDAKALIHTVADTVYLVSPGLFRRYAQEHPEVAAMAKREGTTDWEWAQKRFEKLQLHRKHPGGLNIWTCQVNGPRKSRRLHGYLLQSPTVLFDDCPPNNPYLSLAPCAQPRSRGFSGIDDRPRPAGESVTHCRQSSAVSSG